MLYLLIFSNDLLFSCKTDMLLNDDTCIFTAKADVVCIQHYHSRCTITNDIMLTKQTARAVKRDKTYIKHFGPCKADLGITIIWCQISNIGIMPPCLSFVLRMNIIDTMQNCYKTHIILMYKFEDYIKRWCRSARQRPHLAMVSILSK